MNQTIFKIKSLLKIFMISSTLFCSVSSANKYLDYIYDACERERNTTVHVSYVKYLLEKYYAIRNQVLAGRLSQKEGENLWKEEAENFFDHQHEMRKKMVDTVYKESNKETLAALKLMDQVFDAAVNHTVPKFFSRETMPPDSRITRVFIENCQTIALGSSK